MGCSRSWAAASRARRMYSSVSASSVWGDASFASSGDSAAGGVVSSWRWCDCRSASFASFTRFSVASASLVWSRFGSGFVALSSSLFPSEFLSASWVSLIKALAFAPLSVSRCHSDASPSSPNRSSNVLSSSGLCSVSYSSYNCSNSCAGDVSILELPPSFAKRAARSAFMEEVVGVAVEVGRKGEVLGFRVMGVGRSAFRRARSEVSRGSGGMTIVRRFINKFLNKIHIHGAFLMLCYAGWSTCK